MLQKAFVNFKSLAKVIITCPNWTDNIAGMGGGH
jgi:hypothetical protein